MLPNDIVDGLQAPRPGFGEEPSGFHVEFFAHLPVHFIDGHVEISGRISGGSPPHVSGFQYRHAHSGPSHEIPGGYSGNPAADDDDVDI